MSTSSARLISVSYNVKFHPPEISETEQLKETSQLALRHLAGLGYLLAGLTSETNLREWLDDPPASELRDRRAALDGGLNVLGQLVAAIAEQTIGVLDEYSQAVEERSK